MPGRQKRQREAKRAKPRKAGKAKAALPPATPAQITAYREGLAVAQAELAFILEPEEVQSLLWWGKRSPFTADGLARRYLTVPTLGDPVTDPVQWRSVIRRAAMGAHGTYREAMDRKDAKKFQFRSDTDPTNLMKLVGIFFDGQTIQQVMTQVFEEVPVVFMNDEPSTAPLFVNLQAFAEVLAYKARCTSLVGFSCLPELIGRLWDVASNNDFADFVTKYRAPATSRATAKQSSHDYSKDVEVCITSLAETLEVPEEEIATELQTGMPPEDDGGRQQSESVSDGDDDVGDEEENAKGKGKGKKPAQSVLSTVTISSRGLLYLNLLFLLLCQRTTIRHMFSVQSALTKYFRKYYGKDPASIARAKVSRQKRNDMTSDELKDIAEILREAKSTGEHVTYPMISEKVAQKGHPRRSPSAMALVVRRGYRDEIARLVGATAEANVGETNEEEEGSEDSEDSESE